MKVINADLSERLDYIEIVPLADFHLGDKAADVKNIRRLIEYIRNNDRVYCLLGGDMMDTAIASSIGDTYAATLNPAQQLKTCVELFGDISDKILAIVPGNHENRIYRYDGIDMTEVMAVQLGIADRYSPTAVCLFVRFGRNYKGRKMIYSIYLTHGAGGGRREGGKVNRLVDLANIVDTDVYVMGHTHSPVVVKNGFYRADPNNHVVRYVEKTFVNTSAMLGYGGYGEKQGYKPTSKTVPVICLDGYERQVTVRL